MDNKRKITLILLSMSVLLNLLFPSINSWEASSEKFSFKNPFSEINLNTFKNPFSEINLNTFLPLVMLGVAIYLMFRKPNIAGWILTISSGGTILFFFSMGGLIGLMVPISFGLLLAPWILILIAGIILLKIKSENLSEIKKENTIIESSRIPVSLIIGVLFIIISQILISSISLLSSFDRDISFEKYATQLVTMLLVSSFLGLAQIISFALKLKYGRAVIYGIFILLITSLIYPTWLAILNLAPGELRLYMLSLIVGIVLILKNILLRK